VSSKPPLLPFPRRTGRETSRRPALGEFCSRPKAASSRGGVGAAALPWHCGGSSASALPPWTICDGPLATSTDCSIRDRAVTSPSPARLLLQRGGATSRRGTSLIQVLRRAAGAACSLGVRPILSKRADCRSPADGRVQTDAIRSSLRRPGDRQLRDRWGDESDRRHLRGFRRNPGEVVRAYERDVLWAEQVPTLDQLRHVLCGRVHDGDEGLALGVDVGFDGKVRVGAVDRDRRGDGSPLA